MPDGRTSIWLGGGASPSVQRSGLGAAAQAEVAVIGGGIVGVTTAYLLATAGRDVVLVEARRIGAQTTGHSSAKVTSQHGALYRQLRDTFDADLARRYGEANQWAVGAIEHLAQQLGIDCAFERRDAITYTTDPGRTDDLRDEAELARSLGLPARFVTDVALPFPTAGAVVFADQAQFDPYAYTRGVAAAAQQAGARVVEGVRVTDLAERDGRFHLETTAGEVVAREVVVATNLPFLNDGQYFARALPKAHAVVAGRVAEQPVDGMFISIDEPTRSMRSVMRDGSQWLLLVGGGFTPGDADVEAEIAVLEAFGREHFGMARAEYRWWNEDYYPVDHLPSVGRLASADDRRYVATGFGGWGITNGMVAAQILADTIRGVPNPWADVFDSRRASAATDTNPASQAVRIVRENLATARNLVARLIPGESGSEAVEHLNHLDRGEGAVIELDGDKVAVARDSVGSLHAVSAMCTHLGCELAWNGAMQTWDCGCHGSTFDLDGAVLRGPAVHPLESRADAIRAPADPPGQ